jgi:hypothetical protein
MDVNVSNDATNEVLLRVYIATYSWQLVVFVVPTCTELKYIMMDSTYIHHKQFLKLKFVVRTGGSHHISHVLLE